MTVRVPPGFSILRSEWRACAGAWRCSRTKQTKTWSNAPSLNGRQWMSPLANVTSSHPPPAALPLAHERLVSERSSETMRAPLLLERSIPVCAPRRTQPRGLLNRQGMKCRSGGSPQACQPGQRGGQPRAPSVHGHSLRDHSWSFSLSFGREVGWLFRYVIGVRHIPYAIIPLQVDISLHLP